MPAPLTLADDLLRLNRAGDRDSLLKDKIHERLMARCEVDPASGCWIYTGAWAEDGQGVIRVGQTVCKVARVAAWIYLRGFELWGPQVVYHSARCTSHACFNFEHIVVAENQEAARRDLRAIGRWNVLAGKKLNTDRARCLRREMSRLLEYLSPAAVVRQLSRREGISLRSLRRLLKGTTWTEA